MLTFLSCWGRNPTWCHNLLLHAFATLFWKCTGLIGSQVICALTRWKAYYSRGAVIRGAGGCLYCLILLDFFFFSVYKKFIWSSRIFFLPLFGDGLLWILKVGNCEILSAVPCFTRIFFCSRPSGTCLTRSRGIVSFSSQQTCSRLSLAALSCGADVDHHPFTTICEPFLRRGGRGFCGVRSPVWTHFNCFYALGGLLYLIRRPCIMFGSAIILSPPSS